MNGLTRLIKCRSGCARGTSVTPLLEALRWTKRIGTAAVSFAFRLTAA